MAHDTKATLVAVIAELRAQAREHVSEIERLRAERDEALSDLRDVVRNQADELGEIVDAAGAWEKTGAQSDGLTIAEVIRRMRAERDALQLRIAGATSGAALARAVDAYEREDGATFEDDMRAAITAALAPQERADTSANGSVSLPAAGGHESPGGQR